MYFYTVTYIILIWVILNCNNFFAILLFLFLINKCNLSEHKLFLEYKKQKKILHGYICSNSQQYG